MLRRHTFLAALALVTILGSVEWAAAQPQQGDQQVQPDNQGRRQGRRGRRGRRGPNMDRYYDRITQELNLDEDQVAQLEDIRAAQRERFEQFRQRRDEIRQAERDGDDARAQQLREQMRAEFEQNVGRRGPMEDMVDSINEILTDDQKQQFTTLRQTMRNEREQRMQQRFNDRYDRIAEDLQLDDDQRQVLDDIKADQLEQMNQFRQRWDAVREAYESGDDARGDELREQLVSEMRDSGGPRQFMNQVWDDLDPVLTDDQRARAQELRDQRRQRWQQRRQQPDQNADNVNQDGQAPNAVATDSPPPEHGEGSGNRSVADGNIQEDELASSLQLTGEQMAGYNALQATHKQKTAAINAKITALQKQIADAEDAGDTETVDRLTEELTQQQALLAQQDEAYYQQLEGMLTDTQREALAEYRADLQVAEELKDIPADLRTVLRAAMRLKLDRSQKRQIRDMIKGARDEMRTARKTDRRNRDRDRTAEMKLADKYKTRIRNLLTTEQSLKYTENLEKMTRRRTRSHSRSRGI